MLICRLLLAGETTDLRYGDFCETQAKKQKTGARAKAYRPLHKRPFFQ